MLARSDDLQACNPGDPLVTDRNTWVCDPAAAGLTANQVYPRPVGGDNSFVANLELRYPFAAGRWIWVAFVDLGRVWSSGAEVTGGDRIAWSPGAGIRYQSPVGPLRLDIGYNTGSADNFPVISELVDANGQTYIVQLGEENDELNLLPYNPYEGTGLRGFLNRLQLHFSIGHAF